MESIRNSQTNYAMRLLVVLTSIIVCVAQSNFSRPGEFNPIGSLPPLPQQQQNQNQNNQNQQQQQPQQQIDHSHLSNDGSHQIPSNVIDMPIQITIQGFQGNHVHSHPPMQIVYPVKVALPFQPMQLSFEAHVDIPNEGRESDMTRVDLGPQQMTLFDTSNSAFGTNSIANNNNNNNNNNFNQNQFGNFNNGNNQNNNFNQNTNGIFRGDENGQFNNNQNNQNNNGGNFNGNQNGNFNNNNNNNNNNGIGNNFNGNQNNNNNFNGNFPGNRNDNLIANNQNNNLNNFNGNGNFPQPPTTIQPPPPAGVGVPGIQNIPPFGQNQNQIG